MINVKNIAIIGAGYMAEEHLKVLFKKKIYCEAIYSRTYKKAEELKKKYKIKKNCKSLKELEKINKINGLIIAVSPASTLSILKRIDLNKYKVLCEKPVGVSFKQTEKISALISKNKYFFVGLNRRFYSSTISALKTLRQIKGKRYLSINDQEIQNSNNEFLNKNWMYCNAIHIIDYIRIFCRGKIIKIQKIEKFKNKIFSRNITRLIFSSKDEVLYCCNWNSPGEWSVNIIQKNIRCEMKPLENFMLEKIIKQKRKRLYFEKSKQDKDFKPGIYVQMNEFIKMLENKKNKLISFKEYYESVKVVKEIYE